jgi:hypothetical protein
MKRVVKKFGAFEEQQKADRAYYRSLTPQQRLDILLEMIETYRDGLDEAERGLTRVCRVSERPRR